MLERDADLVEYLNEPGGRSTRKVTEELLVSLFLPDSENKLHDGAVIIKNLRIAQAGAVLPLSANAKLDKALGTRHRAAIGVTEETDAVVVVVSEERGTISLCFGGNIARDLDGATLRKALLGLFQKGQEAHADAARRRRRRRCAARRRLQRTGPSPAEPSPHGAETCSPSARGRRLAPSRRREPTDEAGERAARAGRARARSDRHAVDRRRAGRRRALERRHRSGPRALLDELPLKVVSLVLAVTLFVIVRSDKDARRRLRQGDLHAARRSRAGLRSGRRGARRRARAVDAASSASTIAQLEPIRVDLDARRRAATLRFDEEHDQAAGRAARGVDLAAVGEARVRAARRARGAGAAAARGRSRPTGYRVARSSARPADGARSRARKTRGRGDRRACRRGRCAIAGRARRVSARRGRARRAAAARVRRPAATGDREADVQPAMVRAHVRSAAGAA